MMEGGIGPVKAKNLSIIGDAKPPTAVQAPNTGAVPTPIGASFRLPIGCDL